MGVSDRLYLVDSHCHLDYLKDDLTEVVTRARDAGVKVMQTICVELSGFQKILHIADSFDGVYASVGVHPLHIESNGPMETEALIQHAHSSNKVIGLGECGLDYYRTDDKSDHKLQQEFFEKHIAAAKELDLPIIVHTRNAEDDTIEILRRHSEGGKLKGVIHCFTASYKLAKAALDLGFCISASGIITFNKADDLRESMKKIPIEMLLIETDSPYLAPVPKRGKTNEPSFVYHVAQHLADLKNLTLQEVADHTTDNFFRLFSKAVRNGESR